MFAASAIVFLTFTLSAAITPTVAFGPSISSGGDQYYYKHQRQLRQQQRHQQHCNNYHELFLLTSSSLHESSGSSRNAVVSSPVPKSSNPQGKSESSESSFCSLDQLKKLESVYHKISTTSDASTSSSSASTNNNPNGHRIEGQVSRRGSKIISSTVGSIGDRKTSIENKKTKMNLTSRGGTEESVKTTTTTTTVITPIKRSEDVVIDKSSISSSSTITKCMDDTNNTRRRKMQRSASQYSRVNENPIKKVLLSLGMEKKGKEKKCIGLSREEEIKFSFQLRTFRAAVRLRDSLVYQDHTTGMYIHPTEEQWAVSCGISVRTLRRIMSEGQDARTALVAANVGLVTSYATKFYHATKQQSYNRVYGGVGTIVTVQDLIQEGNLGLMEAAERYEPEKGFRFSTYATWWIKQRILKSITDTGRIIRLPAHVHHMIQKIQRAKRDIMNETGKEPTVYDISQYLEIPVEKVHQYTSRNNVVVSLESPLSSSSSSFKLETRTVGDTLAWENDNVSGSGCTYSSTNINRGGISSGSTNRNNDNNGIVSSGASGCISTTSSSSCSSSSSSNPYDDVETEYLRRDIRAVMDSTLTAVYERDVIIHRFGLDNHEPRSVSETATYLGITNDKVRLIEARALNKLRHPQRNSVLKEYVVSSSSSSSSISSRSSIRTNIATSSNTNTKSSSSSPTTTTTSTSNYNIDNNHNNNSSNKSSSSEFMLWDGAVQSNNHYHDDPSLSLPSWMKHTKDFVRLEGYSSSSSSCNDNGNKYDEDENNGRKRRLDQKLENRMTSETTMTTKSSTSSQTRKQPRQQQREQQQQQQEQGRIWLY